jgi:hypothetical protein
VRLSPPSAPSPTKGEGRHGMAKQCRDSGRQAGDIPFLGGIITCSSGFSTSSGELAVNVLGGSKAHARDIARTKPMSAVSMTVLSPAQPAAEKISRRDQSVTSFVMRHRMRWQSTQVSCARRGHETNDAHRTLRQPCRGMGAVCSWYCSSCCRHPTLFPALLLKVRVVTICQKKPPWCER